MRVADIKRRMTAARKFASNAKPPSAKPKKHKREPAEVSDSSDTEEEDFRVDAKRPRFARDLPHARASLSPGAARKFASNAAPPRPKPPGALPAALPGRGGAPIPGTPLGTDMPPGS